MSYTAPRKLRLAVKVSASDALHAIASVDHHRLSASKAEIIALARTACRCNGIDWQAPLPPGLVCEAGAPRRSIPAASGQLSRPAAPSGKREAAPRRPSPLVAAVPKPAVHAAARSASPAEALATADSAEDRHG